MTEHITVSRELLRQALDFVDHMQYPQRLKDALRAALEQPAVEPLPAFEVGNSGFDHKTAADFLNGKTVGDEAVRKFVAASRRAHDDRASLQSLVATLRQDMAAREAEIVLLKQALLDDEAKEQPAVEPFGHVTVRRLSQRFENHADQYTFYPAGQVPYMDNVDECVPVFTAPTPPADVPLLTDDERYDLYRQVMRGHYIDSLNYWRHGQARKYAKAIEQAVRQKAGLK